MFLLLNATQKDFNSFPKGIDVFKDNLSTYLFSLFVFIVVAGFIYYLIIFFLEYRVIVVDSSEDESVLSFSDIEITLEQNRKIAYSVYKFLPKDYVIPEAIVTELRALEAKEKLTMQETSFTQASDFSKNVIKLTFLEKRLNVLAKTGEMSYTLDYSSLLTNYRSLKDLDEKYTYFNISDKLLKTYSRLEEDDLLSLAIILYSNKVVKRVDAIISSLALSMYERTKELRLSDNEIYLFEHYFCSAKLIKLTEEGLSDFRQTFLNSRDNEKSNIEKLKNTVNKISSLD